MHCKFSCPHHPLQQKNFTAVHDALSGKTLDLFALNLRTNYSVVKYNGKKHQLLICEIIRTVLPVCMFCIVNRQKYI